MRENRSSQRTFFADLFLLARVRREQIGRQLVRQGARAAIVALGTAQRTKRGVRRSSSGPAMMDGREGHISRHAGC